MVRVLFVCLGNICRSPLAEGVFKKKVIEQGLDNKIEVDSCGTSDYHIGQQPDPRTIENAEEHGVFLDHKGRQLTKKDLISFDYIIPMDQSNKRNIELLDFEKKHSDKIKLLREYDTSDTDTEVPDPYFGGEKGFEKVYQIVDTATDRLLGEIRSQHNL